MDQRTVITPTLKRRLAAEASGGPYVCYFAAEGATHTLKGVGAVSPSPLQDMIARDIVGRFNREIHFDGTWLAVLTDLPSGAALVLSDLNYDAMRFLWMDGDGDVQFTIEVWDDPVSVAMAGMVHWMEQAVEAHQQWKRQRDVLDLSERRGELVREAKGEKRAPALIHAEDIIGD